MWPVSASPPLTGHTLLACKPSSVRLCWRNLRSVADNELNVNHELPSSTAQQDWVHTLHSWMVCNINFLSNLPQVDVFACLLWVDFIAACRVMGSQRRRMGGQAVMPTVRQCSAAPTAPPKQAPQGPSHPLPTTPPPARMLTYKSQHAA